MEDLIILNYLRYVDDSFRTKYKHKNPSSQSQFKLEDKSIKNFLGSQSYSSIVSILVLIGQSIASEVFLQVFLPHAACINHLELNTSSLGL